MVVNEAISLMLLIFAGAALEDLLADHRCRRHLRGSHAADERPHEPDPPTHARAGRITAPGRRTSPQNPSSLGRGQAGRIVDAQDLDVLAGNDDLVQTAR